MPAVSFLLYSGEQYPPKCDSVPQGKSRVGRGFHPKKKRTLREEEDAA